MKRPTYASLPDAELGLQAAEWAVRMASREADPEDDLYPSTLGRNAAFRDWYTRSPRHLQAFFDVCEVDARAHGLDPRGGIDVEALLARREAEVIGLHRWRLPTTAERSRNKRRRRAVRAAWLAAAAVLAGIGSIELWLHLPADEYVTGVGEQRKVLLADGSLVHLNTDTRIAIDYTPEHRDVRLIKGEALFIIAPDPVRPFVAMAGNARVRALGTQFNLRERTGAVEVAVVEGLVQVSTRDTAASSPHGAPSALPADLSTTRLAAGDAARITAGGVVRAAPRPISDVISWQQRQLVFKDATLAEVAMEFNRYSKRKIQVVGPIPVEQTNGPLVKAAVFHADHPEALILFAEKEPTLAVERDGENWIVRGR